MKRHIFIIALLLVSGCESESEKLAKEQKILQEKQEQDKLHWLEEVEAAKKQEAERQEKIEAAKTVIKNLKSNFKYKKDEFDNDETYKHKNYDKYVLQPFTILASISNASLLVMPIYHDKEWIFYESIIVKIGDSTITATGDTDRKIGTAGYVSEYMILTGKTEENVLRFIANNPKETVRVRLIGKHYKDYTLHKAHQQALLETLEFYNALKILKDNGIDHKSLN